MPLAGARADQVGLEHRESGEDVEEHSALGVGGIIYACPQCELDVAFDQSVSIGARREPEPRPPQAGTWCTRRERRPNVRLNWRGNNQVVQSSSVHGY